MAMDESEYSEIKERLWRVFRACSDYAETTGKKDSYQANQARAVAGRATAALAAEIRELEDSWDKRNRRTRQPDR